MSDPRRDPATGRFLPGPTLIPGGKPAGTRNRIGAAFLKALSDDFEEHGKAALEAVRAKDPLAYLNFITKILPKEVAGEEGGPVLNNVTVTFVKPA